MGDWKPLLRAVLMSSKEGVTAHRLTSEYRGITNEPLPFRKLGFDNLHDFMKSIPDIAAIGRTKDTGETCYFAVADESTKGLQRMIACQKGKSKKRGRPGKSFMPRRPMTRYGGGGATYRPSPHKFGPRQQQQNSYQQRPRPQQKYEPPARPNPRVPLRQPGDTRNTLPERTIINNNSTSNIKFGEKFDVPPRFLKQLTSTDKTKKTAISPILAPPKTPAEKSHIYKSKNEAEQSAAKNACKDLGLEHGSKKRWGGDNLNLELSDGEEDEFELGSSVHGDRLGSNFDKTLVQERVREILLRRTNGLWESRLLVEYEEKYNEKPPANLNRHIEKWPHIVKIESVPHTDRRILYPIQSLRIVSGPSGDHGRKVEVVNNKPELQKIQDLAIPPVASKLNVFISHIIDPSHFYVQKENSDINQIMEEIEKEYGGRFGPKILTHPEPGMFCVSKYSADKGWYRAQIHSTRRTITGANEVEIYYVDFGNSEVRPAAEVCEISAAMCRKPIQAYRCQLHGVLPAKGTEWSEEAISMFNKCSMDKELTINVENILGTTLVCNVFDSKRPTLSLNQFLIKRNLAIAAEEGGHIALAPTQNYPENLSLPTETFWDVYVSYVRNTNYLVVRLVGDEYSEKLEQLEEDMENFYTNKPNAPQHSPKVDGLYVACAEECWYRVQVNGVDGDQVDCLFLDHGDSEILNESQLRLLEPRFNQLPYQAVTCSLAGLEQFEDNEVVVEKLFELALGKTCVAEVLERGEKCSINLFDTSGEEDVNVNEMLGTMVADEELAPTLPAIGGTVDGYVSYVSQRGTIFFQVLGPGLQRLEEFMEDIAEHYSKKTSAQEFVSNPLVGKVCCAKYSEDNFWYRAVVRKVLPQRKVKVQYVDYGNSEVVLCSSLREPTKANKHLATLPYQAVECELVNLPPPGKWTEEAVSRLLFLMPMDALRILKVHKVGTKDNLPQVEIILTDVDQNEVSVNDLLLQEPDIFLPPELRKQRQPITDDSLTSKMAEVSFKSERTSTPIQMSEMSPNTSRSADAMEAGADSPLSGSPVGKPRPAETVNGSAKELNNNPSEEKEPQTPPASDSESGCATLNFHDIARAYDVCAALPPPPSLNIPNVGEYMDIHIPWSCDPDSFIAISYSSMKHLVEMMEVMRVFYADESLHVKIPAMKPGELYAGYQELSWYRVVVKAVLPDNQVSVHFMDYGDFGILASNELQPLPAVFRELPYQAIKASISGICPTSATGWSDKAVHRFSELVNEKSLVSLICSHDKSSGAIGVRLIDTSEDEVDVCVDEVLVKEGLAKKT